MKRRIGTCSLCGGDVMQTTAWLGVGPPPKPECASCGARAKGRDDTIEMERPRETFKPPEPCVHLSTGFFSKKTDDGVAQWFECGAMVNRRHEVVSEPRVQDIDVRSGLKLSIDNLRIATP